MASPAQHLANSQNAQSSSGPRTEEGKKRSRFNAFRHGLTSQLVVLPGEDVEAYHAFSAEYHEDLQPKGIVEAQLVQTLADIQWRLNRAKAHEAALFAMGTYEQSTEPGAPSLSPDVITAFREASVRVNQTAALSSLSMHEARWQKLYFTSLKQLQELQTARHARESEEMQQAVALLKYHKEKKIPFEPQNFGFVLTEHDVELYMWRTNTCHAADLALFKARENARAARENPKKL